MFGLNELEQIFKKLSNLKLKNMFAKNEGVDQKTKEQFAELGMNVSNLGEVQ